MAQCVRPQILRLSVRHVCGLRRIEYREDEVVVVCVVRNGELHIRSFLDHYFGLGVKHVVLLLNDSADRTAELAASYANVTLLRTNCPYSRYENLMKRYLAQRFSMDRWNLCVDIDELFDYPYSNELPLGALLQYLNREQYTAVVAQMLDMFSDGPLALVRSSIEDQVRLRYRWYDISGIHKSEYPYSQLTLTDVKMHWGGIREQAFGTNNGLTKAPLVKVGRNQKLFVYWHHVVGATIADFTAVLLHYPFVENFAAKVVDAVATGRYGPETTREYHQYWGETRRQDKALVLRKASARTLDDVATLLDEQFLVAGPSFREWRRAYVEGQRRNVA
jgi:hypothetical protein